MNKKDECEIVRDLAVQYIEKSISGGSENFVEKHLNNCEECKEYYKILETKIGNEDEKDKILTKQFKKIHKHISILKIILIAILIVALVTSLIIWGKQKNFSNLVNEVSKKIEYMETLDNYKITVKTIQKNFVTEENLEYEETYYYKDGKLKIESEDSIFFYEDDSYDSIKIYHDLKQIDYIHSNVIQKRKGDSIGLLSYIKENYESYSSTIYSLIFSIREERYNGINCYVIRFGNKDNYRDIWIDKNNYITIREVNENHSNYYNERIFTFEENVVNDNDVDNKILNTEKYNDYKRLYNETELPEEIIEKDNLYLE